MKLSNEAITSFQKLYQNKCGVELDYEKAQVMALAELKCFALVYKSVPVKDLDIFNEFSIENSNN